MTKPWLETIDEGEARGYFTDEDKRRIQSWPTCFVGELLPGYNRFLYIPTVDMASTELKIWKLGVRASDAVYDNDFIKARYIYSQIAKLVKAIER